MKANEIPEIIYISLIPSISEGYVYTTVNKDFPNAIEYTRTDDFIEKAVVWISNNCYIPHATLEDFKNYMKGE